MAAIAAKSSQKAPLPSPARMEVGDGLGVSEVVEGEGVGVCVDGDVVVVGEGGFVVVVGTGEMVGVGVGTGD